MAELAVINAMSITLPDSSVGPYIVRSPARRSLIAIMIAGVMAGGCVHIALADPADLLRAPVPIKVKRIKSSFENLLASISAENRVAFVVEGRSSGKNEYGPPRERAPYRGSVTAIVQKVALAYDYTAEREGGVFLLKRRYSDPRDIPDVSLEECKQSLDDVRRITAAFDPHVPPPLVTGRDGRVGELVASFTPDQIRRLQGETDPGVKVEGLRIASLQPDQKMLAWRLVRYFAVQSPLEDIDVVRSQLAAITDPTSTVSLGFSNDHGSSVLYCKVTARDALQPSMIRLERSGSPFPQPPPNQSVMHGSENAGDSSGPRRTPNGMTKATSYTSLGQVVADLNKQRGGVLATVDVALSNKAVMVIGRENARPDEILNAIASDYGLTIVTHGRQRFVARRPVHDVSSLADLPEAVRDALPAPYLRMMHSNQLYALVVSDGADAAEQGALLGGGLPLEQPADRRARGKEIERLLSLPDHIREQASERLRSDIAGQLAADPGGQVPLAELTEEDKAALALILASNCVNGLNKIVSRPTPQYVTRFSDLTLLGRVYTDRTGQKKVDLSMCLPDATDEAVYRLAVVGGANLVP